MGPKINTTNSGIKNASAVGESSTRPYGSSSAVRAAIGPLSVGENTGIVGIAFVFQSPPYFAGIVVVGRCSGRLVSSRLLGDRHGMVW